MHIAPCVLVKDSVSDSEQINLARAEIAEIKLI